MTTRKKPPKKAASTGLTRGKPLIAPDAVRTAHGRAGAVPPPQPPPHPGGRPTKLTPELSARIIAAVRAGSYIEEAAAAVGVAQSTLHLWLQKGRDGVDQLHLEFSEAVERARAEDSVRDLALITKAATLPAGDLDWRAAAWKRERKDPGRWGMKIRITLAEEIESFLDDCAKILPAEWYEKVLEAAASRIGGTQTDAAPQLEAEGEPAAPR